MQARKFRFHQGKKGVALAVRVIPRAPRTEISGIMEDGTLKIRVKAPPVDGKANQALIEFLAGVLGVPQSRIEIVAGQTHRNKLVSIEDLDPKVVQDRIHRSVNPS